MKFFLLHLCEKSSSFIWGNIFFCTMDGFSRILEKKLCHLLCTRLYIDEEPGIKIFYCTEEFTKIRQRHLLLEQTFTWNSPIILPPLFFWQENLLWNCYIVTATLTCTIIKGHACLFFSRKKVQPTLWFSCNRLKIPPYPLVLRVRWIFYPIRLL